MKIASVALAAILATGLASAAQADSPRCQASASQSALSIEQAIAKAETIGYAVKEAKRSKGCWKIEGFDRNGAEIEIRLDPVSGDVVKPHDWRAPTKG
jgi:hypothetical protein